MGKVIIQLEDTQGGGGVSVSTNFTPPIGKDSPSKAQDLGLKMAEIARANASLPGQTMETVCYDHNLRAEKIVHLGLMFLEDIVADDARDAFDDDWDEVWTAIGLEPPIDEDIEDVGFYLAENKCRGLLIRFSTPVPQHIHSNSYSFSWGYYRTKWFYGDVLEEILTRAAEWQKQFIEEKLKQIEVTE